MNTFEKEYAETKAKLADFDKKFAEFDLSVEIEPMSGNGHRHRGDGAFGRFVADVDLQNHLRNSGF